MLTVMMAMSWAGPACLAEAGANMEAQKCSFINGECVLGTSLFIPVRRSAVEIARVSSQKS